MTLIASTVFAGALALATAAPAQAVVVDVAFGPLSIGDYCHANVSSSAWIGFYESSGLRCYASGTGPPGGLQFVGYGSPYLACKYLTTDVVMSALRGGSDGLVCRVVR
jgi:hypothetical protein